MSLSAASSHARKISRTGLFRLPLDPQFLVLLVSFFLIATTNLTFFRHLAHTYGTTVPSLLRIGSVAVVFLVATFCLLSLATWWRLLKPVLILILIISSQTAYFMDTYDVVINTNMLRNVLETNLQETRDLLSLTQLGYSLVLGLLPAAAVYLTPVAGSTTRKLLLSKIRTVGLALGIALVIIATSGRFYASFFREHKPLRYYSNPVYYLYAAAGLLASVSPTAAAGPVQPLGADVVIPEDRSGRRLIIVVVGEAARWDHFSLNGYLRKTNPLLEQEQVINLPNVSSCGTETGVSVPCMFSVFGRRGYEKQKVSTTENVLDILQRAGVSVLWRDNNSDSKGVALRVPYEDFRTSAKNPVCENGECRDEGMLAGLQEYLQQHPKGDIVIVLHQMGNHGPAYYKRYPKSFEKFAPVCSSNQLEQCSPESIGNAYDNALLYTDYFLAKVIAFLKQNQTGFQTAMLYMADHGESLGEKGLYLHGFPYAIAPEAQTHVGALLWFGQNFPVNRQDFASRAKQPYSHDYIFHSLLGLVGAQTSVYRPELDMFNGLIVQKQ